jgi:hypothetical protein
MQAEIVGHRIKLQHLKADRVTPVTALRAMPGATIEKGARSVPPLLTIRPAVRTGSSAGTS